MDDIIQGDCLEVMKTLATESIDLTVTSPPYDNLRDYNGYTFDFEGIAKELYRVTKQGGVVVWVVGDATIKGSETGTSFRQALFFKEIGFSMETMIWEKTGSGCLGSNKFYGQNFEYNLLFVKGKPFHGSLIKDRENILKSGVANVNCSIDKDGESKRRTIKLKPYGKRNNIWRIQPKQNSSHPAPFPLALAQDHIISWSNEHDVVLDPMCGSGTTCKRAEKLNRRWIGIEISEEYCEIAAKRIEQETKQRKMF